MKYQALVVNGCSYMEAYARGFGHQHLAEQLNIPTAASLAIAGSANNRIIRTTIKHSYHTTVPTFYVIGMTFLSRDELPILNPTNEFEGRWSNPQNQDFEAHWAHPWDRACTDLYCELKLKWEWASARDRFEDLSLRVLSMINDLRFRGHTCLVYNQADDLPLKYLNDGRPMLIQKCVNVVDGYRWRAVPWQHSRDVPSIKYADSNAHHVPPEMVHPAPGFHQLLNDHLTKYINSNKILE